jgi:7-cyano-7-deazaguanine synthase in queuosine biosynthesis
MTSEDSRIGLVGTTPINVGDITINPKNILTDWVRISLLTTLAGYSFQDQLLVKVFNPSIKDKNSLESFLSYLLQYPAGLPHIFNIKLELEKSCSLLPPPDASSRVVVLASGGLDSAAGLMWALESGRKPMACWVDYGQPYRDIELQAVSQITRQLQVPLECVQVDLSRYIRLGQPIWGHIFPARNFLLACIAAAFQFTGAIHPHERSEVLLCAHEDEMFVADKSARFYRTASEHLKKDIHTPFAAFNKTELLAYWRRKWADTYGLYPQQTVTCYAENGKCGTCKACLKRTLSLLAAGWPIESDLKINPLSDPVGILKNDYLPRFSSFPLKRQLDMLVAFNAGADFLPPAIKEFTEQRISQNSETVELRQQEIERTIIL